VRFVARIVVRATWSSVEISSWSSSFTSQVERLRTALGSLSAVVKEFRPSWMERTVKEG
jgi:hypothetical protein